MNELKAQLRRLIYQARNAQPDKEAVSREICSRFTQLPAYRRAETVMWYIHCRSEVRTESALAAALTEGGKRCVIPYCTQDRQGQRVLGLWRLASLSELKPGTWGILEPPPERRQRPGRIVTPDALDLVMVPGVAFDRDGGRLGNGAGYYDRLLREVRPDAVLIGVCYQSQMLAEVPLDRHDIVMDYVITEQALYKGRGRRV